MDMAVFISGWFLPEMGPRPRSSGGCFKPILDPGSGFSSVTTAQQFLKLNSRYEAVSKVKRLQVYIYKDYIYVTAIIQRKQVPVRM
jgi:hypothetical protein